MTTQSLFNYGLCQPFVDYSAFGLSDSRIRDLERFATTIEYQPKLNMPGIYRIGRALFQSQFVFGQNSSGYLRWLKLRLPFLTYDFCFRLTALYRRFGVSLVHKPLKIESSVLSTILMSSTPYSAVVQIIARAITGDVITVSVSDLIISRSVLPTLPTEVTL